MGCSCVPTRDLDILRKPLFLDSSAIMEDDLGLSDLTLSNCTICFHQCRDREWYGVGELRGEGEEAWGWQAAEKMLENGFAVVRVKTRNWWDLLRGRPELFEQNLFGENQNRQHIICAVSLWGLLGFSF